MTPQTIADIHATCDLIRFLRSRVSSLAESFSKDNALDAISDAEKCLKEAENVLSLAPTLEDRAMVLRISLQLVKGKKKCAEVGNG